MNEATSSVFTCMSFLAALATLGLAVIAVIKLKGTPSGLLMATGFALMGVVSLSTALYRMAVLTPALEAGELHYEQHYTQLAALSSCSGMSSLLGWMLVGVGALLLPASLKKLGERSR